MTQSPATGATRDLYRHFIDGWNQRDVRAITAALASDAVVIGFDGGLMRGPAELSQTFGMIFAEHQPHRFVTIERSITVLAPTVARYIGDVGFVAPGETEIVESLNARQVMIAVLRDTGWKISLLQTTPATLHGQPGLHLALSEELREMARRQVPGLPED